LGQRKKKGRVALTRPCQFARNWVSGRLELLHFQLSWLVGAASPHFSSATITTMDITRLFVELTFAHLFFHTGMFDKFSETTNGLINTFIISQTQLNHKNPPLEN